MVVWVAMVVQVVGWLIAIPILAMVKLPPPVGDGRFSLFADLRVGWSEFWSRSWLVAVVFAFMILNAIHVGAWGVVGPYIAKNDDRLGIAGWGWVVSAEGVGVLLMTLVLMWFPMKRPLRLGMIGISIFAIPLTMLGVHPAVVLVAIAAFLAGAGAELFSTGWNVAMMENIPTEKLSRVSSYDMLGSFVVMPIGTLVYGWLITHADPAVVLTTSGILYAAIALVTLFVPSVWKMGRVEAAARGGGAPPAAPPPRGGAPRTISSAAAITTPDPSSVTKV